MELTLRLVTTFATTVPTFFMRLNPTSSIANPACMNMTRQAATITQTVSAATPAACVAVVSSARTAIGMSPASTATPAEIPSTRLRRMSAFQKSMGTGNDVTSVSSPWRHWALWLMRSAYGLPVPLKTCGLAELASPALCPSHETGTAVGVPNSCEPHRKEGHQFVPGSPDRLAVRFLRSLWDPSDLGYFGAVVHGGRDKVGQQDEAARGPGTSERCGRR